jgi:hypothetical protein
MVVLILVSTQVYCQTLIKINQPSIRVKWTFTEDPEDSEYFEIRTHSFTTSENKSYFTTDTTFSVDTSMVATGWYSLSVRAIDAVGQSSRWVNGDDCADENVEQCFIFRLKDAIPNTICGLQLTFNKKGK